MGNSSNTKEMNEIVQASLEEAIENYIAPIENDEGLDYINFNGQEIKDAFKAGAEWQKQRDAELIEIAYNDGITIGKTKQKEQMMKDAVEGEVSAVILRENRDEVHYAVTYPEGEGPHSITSKVRIIIVKED